MILEQTGSIFQLTSGVYRIVALLVRVFTSLLLRRCQKCGETLDNGDIVTAANRVKSSFLKEETINQLGLLNFDQRHMLTHFYAYIMEALVELGRIDLAQIGMKSVAKYQKSDGGARLFRCDMALYNDKEIPQWYGIE